MGLADLVPGVSGGTIAFIAGIYDRLLTAIGVISSLPTWQFLLRGQISLTWRIVDGTFLCVLGAGIFGAIFLGAGIVRHLLETQSITLLAFFCGLTLAAAVTVSRQIRQPNWRLPVFLAIGCGLSLAIILTEPGRIATAPPAEAFLLAGMVASVAMILPGISGSFILLLIGIYPFLLDAVVNRDFAILAIFATGSASGLLILARFLSAALRNYHDAMIALLCGLMLGALPKLWPWKEATAGIRTILQPATVPWLLDKPDYWNAGAGFCVGLILILALDYLTRRRTPER